MISHINVNNSAHHYTETFYKNKQAVHAYEHLQEQPPDSWDFLNQDFAIKHPTEFKLINDEGEGMKLAGELRPEQIFLC